MRFFGLLFMLALVFVAAPAEAQSEQVSILIMDIKADPSIPKTEVHTVNELVATSFSRYQGLNVLSSGDVQQALELEGDRQAAGCDDESSACLAELAGALGAQYVVFGKLGQLGKLYILNLNLYDSSQAKSVVREKLQVDSIEDMPQKIDATVEKMARIFAEKTGAVDVSVEEEGGSALFWTGALLGGIGLASAIGFGATAFISDGVVGSRTGTDKDTWKSLGIISVFVASGSGVVALTGAGLATLGMME
jgi:TolB-like protein